ncbi:hypothetical protein ACTA71_005056 [Dictyostelium dimigraforme]
MDILFFKIFRNIFLFQKIFGYVKNSRFGFYSLSKINISVVLKDNRLLSQYYQSYVYNKQNGNDNKNVYDEILQFMIYDPTIITYEMFKTLYGDNLDYYENKTHRLMRWYFSFSDNVKIIQYLIEQCSLKIFILTSYKDETKCMANLESYILFLSKNKIYNSKQSTSLSSSTTSISTTSISTNLIIKSTSTRLEILDYLIETFKKETNKPLDKEIELSYEVLIQSLDFGCEIEYYERLFKLCLKDLKRSELHIATLLGKLIKFGNLEMTDLYIKEFQSMQCRFEDKIENCVGIKPVDNSIYGNGSLDLIFKSLKKSISVFIKLVKNNNIRFGEFKQLNRFFFLNQLSIEDYYELIEYCNKKEIQKRLDTEDSQIIKIANLKTLKYLIENKNSFSPSLTFDRALLLTYTTTLSKDFDSFQFIVDPKNYSLFKREVIINLNSNYQIIKYSLDHLTKCNLQNVVGGIRFSDTHLTNSFCGDKELVKYLIEKRIGDPNSPIQLTYRSLDRVCENGQTELAKLFVEYEPTLRIGISRDAINNAIKSGNLETVELLKDVEVTKPGEIKLIQESSVSYIIKNSRNDIFDSLLNSSYSKFLKDTINLMNVIIPENILKILN